MRWSETNTARATVTAIAAVGMLTTAGGIAATPAGAAAGATNRPAAEHVPTSLHTAEVMYENGSGAAHARLVRGAGATRLITLFNALTPEPRNTIHCDIAGGPTTIVSFQGAHHLWKATESACTDVQVTRDGNSLPTLLPSRAWRNTVSKYLGN